MEQPPWYIAQAELALIYEVKKETCEPNESSKTWFDSPVSLLISFGLSR